MCFELPFSEETMKEKPANSPSFLRVIAPIIIGVVITVIIAITLSPAEFKLFFAIIRFPPITLMIYLSVIALWWEWDRWKARKNSS